MNFWSHDEANVSTEQQEKTQQTRISRTYADESRAEGDFKPSRARTVTFNREQHDTALSENTLKRHEILKSRERISRILRQGRRYHGEHVTLYCMPSEKMGFAVLVKKNSGKPYQRNKVKRWVREIYRMEKDNFPAPCDIIILVQGAYGFHEFHALKTDVETLFKKVRSNPL